MAAARWVAAAAGTLLPFLVLLVALAFALRLLGVRVLLRRRHATATPAAPGAE